MADKLSQAENHQDKHRRRTVPRLLIVAVAGSAAALFLLTTRPGQTPTTIQQPAFTALSVTLPPTSAAWTAYHCDPQPCWHNLRVGSTTQQQAEDILRQDAGILTLKTRPGEITFELSTSASVVADFGNDEKLATLNFTGLSGTLNLGNAIDLFGQPTRINANALYPDFKILYVTFRSDTIMWLEPHPWLKSCRADGLCTELINITPDMTITRITIDAGSDDPNKKFHLQGPIDWGCQEPWQGYGNYATSSCL